MSKTAAIISKIKTEIDRHPLIFLVLISLAVQIWYLAFRFPLWWDSYVYVGMGKFLASQGKAGLFELFRPPLFPLILGGLWRIGFDPLIVGPILDVIFSLTTTALTLAIGTKIFNKTVGFYAAILVCLNPIFLMHTGLILTEPLAMMLALIAVLLMVRENREKKKKNYPRYCVIGMVTALSFLSKFPQGLLLPAILFTIFIASKTEKSMILRIKQSAAVTSGFLLLIIPYLLINYRYFADPLAPLKSGSWIVTTATWLYGSGITYYISHFFLLSPIFFLFFAYLWIFLREREYLRTGPSLLVFFSLLMIIYFLTVPRKEARYLVTIVPALAILAVTVVERCYHFLQQQERQMIYPKALIALCVIGTLLFLPQAFTVDSSENGSGDLHQVLKDHPTTGFILTNDPSPASVTDNKMILFGGMDTAMIAYEAYRNESGLIVVRDCNFVCSLDDPRCEEQKRILLNRITEDNQQIFHKTVKGCTIAVYSPSQEEKQQ